MAVSMDSFKIEIADGYETDDKSCIDATCHEDVKPFDLGDVPDMASISKKHGLHSTSGLSAERDFEADVKLEELRSDEDIKPKSLNPIQDMTSLSMQVVRFNYNSNRSMRGSGHEILDDREKSEYQYLITSDSKPLTEHAPISPAQSMKVSCLENQCKKEIPSPSPMKPSSVTDPIVILSGIDHIVAGNACLENDIAGRPSWSDTPLLKTEANDLDSRSFLKDCPGNNHCTVAKDRLQVEFGENTNIADSSHQIQQSGPSRTVPFVVSRCHPCDKASTAQFFSISLKDVQRNEERDIPGKDKAQVKRCKGQYRSVLSSSRSNQIIRTNLEEEPLKVDHYRTSFSEKRHTREKPFKCYVCHKSFAARNSLHIHIRTHTGERPFKCDYCHKSFKISSNLDRHILTHTGEKPFKCVECHKCFARSNQLSDHMRTHTGEKPYKCVECHKSFAYRSGLHYHMRTHTGEKPFKCDQCNMDFAISSNLHTHMRTHTGEKPFKCVECHKCFARTNQLSDHMRTHTGEKPYKCVECHKGFIF